MEIIRKTKLGFDSLPTQAKIIIFAGLSSFLALMVVDLQALDYAWTKYAIIPLTVGINLVAWYVLRIKK